MRRMIPIIALIAAACNPQTEDGSGGGSMPAPTPGATDGATPSPTPTELPPPEGDAQPEARRDDGSFDLTEETDLYLFQYQYPAAVGEVPELAELLDRRQERARASLARSSATARGEARDRGFPYNKHSYLAEWKVVANMRDWLSLSADVATYSGGAHGNYGIEALIWDRLAQRALQGIDLFTSPAALREAVDERFCELLDEERAKRRGEPVVADAEDGFTQCPPMDDLVLLLGSSNRRSFDRMTLYAGPYVAGPYAEGAYEINLPVTRAVIEAVEPQYRDSFRARN